MERKSEQNAVEHSFHAGRAFACLSFSSILNIGERGKISTNAGRSTAWKLREKEREVHHHCLHMIHGLCS
jgi:hypothetical protein